MEIVLLPEAKKDLALWVKSGNKTILKKVTELIEQLLKIPSKELANLKV